MSSNTYLEVMNLPHNYFTSFKRYKYLRDVTIGMRNLSISFLLIFKRCVCHLYFTFELNSWQLPSSEIINCELTTRLVICPCDITRETSRLGSPNQSAGRHSEQQPRISIITHFIPSTKTSLRHFFSGFSHL